MYTRPTPQVLRTKEAASFIGVGVSTFWRWVKEGKVPQGILLSRRCRVWPVQDLIDFLDAKRDVF